MKVESAGIPEKGRNAGIALRRELPLEYNEEFILDVLNGKGKQFAKTGQNREEIQEWVSELDFIEFKDTGRPFPRPGFTELFTGDLTISSYEEQPMEQEFDRFYQGFDQMIEENCSPEEISRDFEDLVRDVASDQGYRLEQMYGDRVKWAAMNSSLEKEPETVLIPEKFPSLGEAVAENYWDSQPDCTSFETYAEENGFSGMEEEAVIAESPAEVAGAYMFVSGSTAEEERLDYEPIPGFTSRLGRFQNQYKNSVENRF